MALLKKTRRGMRKRPSGKFMKQRTKSAGVKKTGAAENEAAAAAVKPEEIRMDAAPKVSADKVFHYFREIAGIPHGSGHTKAISDHIVSFAKERDLFCVQDELNNVIITKEATPGYEDAPPIALQGHIDMVLASRSDKDIDMLTEPVTVITEDDWMHADGTTLGADNGIAAAMMLAVLDDDTITHPLLECIFTSDEEIGLIGAAGIDLSELKSRRLLNLDNEKEGVFCAGCAGGADAVCELPVKRRHKAGRCLTIRLSGLSGGHSGAEIHLGRANGNRLLARALYRIYDRIPFRLVRIEGGDANNAIPPHALAKIQFPAAVDTELVEKILKEQADEMADEFRSADPGMKWETEWEPASREYVVTKNDTIHLLRFLMALPTGITHMSTEIPGMPQTSLNLGVIGTEVNKVRADFMVRSGINSQGQFTLDRLASLAAGFGADFTVRSSYPAWEYREESPLRDLAVNTYRKYTGKEPVVEVIHAGLECGVLSGKLPGLDCLSTGPDLENVHTVNERMSISSAENVWNFVVALLKEAALTVE